MSWTRAACALACAVTVLAGCGRGGPPNLLVVVLDTLRADRLGCYGNPRGLTPFIDSLAARGAVFRHAYAQSSWTNPSVASLLTSRFQSQHGVVSFESVLGDAEITLPEVLKAHRYATAAFTANGLLAKALGYGQGFDEYRAFLTPHPDLPTYLWIPERAGTVNHAALDWLDAATPEKRPRGPTFLYVQYMEPHTPYDPDPILLDRLLGGRRRPDMHELNQTVFFGHLLAIPPDTLRDIEDVYDAEVMAADAALHALFSELERRRFLAHAVVVVTADHGEEFKDHGLMGHEKSLYEEVIHVPLIVLAPGTTRRIDVDDVVSLIDVAPTLLELAGIASSPTFEGTSLVAALGRAPGGAPRPGPAYSELLKPPAATRRTPHERAVVLGREKLIVGTGGERERYRLDQDPGEHHPLPPDAAGGTRVEELFAAFREHVAKRNATAAGTIPLDEDAKRGLRALGYVQ